MRSNVRVDVYTHMRGSSLQHMESSAAVEEGEERLLRQRAAKRQRERERRASETAEQRGEIVEVGQRARCRQNDAPLRQKQKERLD